MITARNNCDVVIMGGGLAAWPSAQAQAQALPAPDPVYTGRAAGGSRADVTIQSINNPGLSYGVDR